jgi:hypothetical protein
MGCPTLTGPREVMAPHPQVALDECREGLWPAVPGTVAVKADDPHPPYTSSPPHRPTMPPPCAPVSVAHPAHPVVRIPVARIGS